MNKDMNFEGRKKVYLDIDRMVNEGLAGGTINNKYKEPEVDEARSLEQEVRPRKSNSD